MKPEIKSTKKTGKSTNLWKFNKIFLNDQQVKKEKNKKLENTLRQMKITTPVRCRGHSAGSIYLQILKKRS